MSNPAQGYGQGQQSYNPQASYQPSSYQQDECPNFSFEREDMNKVQSTPLRDLEGVGFPNVPPNPLSAFLANFLEAVVALSTKVSHQLYTNSSVIVIAAGLAGGVHHFASQHSSLANAALDASFHGSVAVAKYVGLAFIIKTALTPIHKAFTGEVRKNISEFYENERISPEVRRAKDTINSHVISYLTPMALAWIVAYSRGIPVKLGCATLYTIGTFGLMKLLGMGYDYALTKWGQRAREGR
jgi:hypothetical protein